MLYVSADGGIRLTRGDTARLTVAINNDVSGSEYVMKPDDVLTLTIKKSIKDEVPRLQKTIKGQTTFHIEPNDTADMQFSKYMYDVQLTTSGGDVYTIIEPTLFEIMPEVTC